MCVNPFLIGMCSTAFLIFFFNREKLEDGVTKKTESTKFPDPSPLPFPELEFGCYNS